MPLEPRPRLGRVSGSLLLLEAAVSLGLARLAVQFFSFPQLARFVSQPLRRAELSGRERRLARWLVNRAIFRAWRGLPLENTCIHRALAAHWMLRRRGVSTTLFYGAATQPGAGLTGHIWLQDGVEMVVGSEAARGLPQLAHYP